MYHTTGFSKDEIVTLGSMIAERLPAPAERCGRRSVLGLFTSVTATLCYLRRNHVQQELAELFGASQATISRTIARYVPILSELLADWVPTVGGPRPRRTADHRRSPAAVLVLGRSPRVAVRQTPHHRPQRPSRLHPACTLGGHLAWVSDPAPGKTHDAKAIRDSGVFS